jgi:hypothetical protein
MTVAAPTKKEDVRTTDVARICCDVQAREREKPPSEPGGSGRFRAETRPLVMVPDISMGPHDDATGGVSVRSKTLPASRAGMHRRYSIPTLLLPNALRLELCTGRLVHNLVPDLGEGPTCSCQSGDG